MDPQRNPQQPEHDHTLPCSLMLVNAYMRYTGNMSGQQREAWMTHLDRKDVPCRSCSDRPAVVVAHINNVRPLCDECVSGYITEWTEQSYNRTTIRKYGITGRDHLALFIEQRGLCAICGTHSSDRRLVIDHDHDTGEVRGLLCPQCNSAIGLLQDTSGIVAKARSYLGRHHRKKQGLTESQKRQEARKLWYLMGKNGPPPK